MKIELPAALTAEYSTFSWIGGKSIERPHVRVQFGHEHIVLLEPVREFGSSYDSRCDEEQEQAIANETLAAALTKLFALLDHTDAERLSAYKRGYNDGLEAGMGDRP